MIFIKLDGVDEALKLFDPQTVVQAARASINRTARSAKTHASRLIRQEYNIPASRVNMYLTLSVKARGNDIHAEIMGKGLGIPLVHFGARQEGKKFIKGENNSKILVKTKRRKASSKVSVLVKRSSGRKVVTGEPRPFMAQMRSGHIGVFQREGGKKLPIKEMLGPGVGGLFGSDKIMKSTKEFINEKFRKELQHNLDYYQRRNKK